LEEMMEERGVVVDHSLGDQILAVAGKSIPKIQASGRRPLADGRDVHQGQGRLEISLSRR
jgi:hypothetical protein